MPESAWAYCNAIILLQHQTCSKGRLLPCEADAQVRSCEVLALVVQREMRVQLMSFFPPSFTPWVGKALTDSTSEVHQTMPAALPGLVREAGLSERQVEDLVDARRQFCAERRVIREEQASILQQLKAVRLLACPIGIPCQSWRH